MTTTMAATAVTIQPIHRMTKCHGHDFNLKRKRHHTRKTVQPMVDQGRDKH
jgi:hypothetical protein